MSFCTYVYCRSPLPEDSPGCSVCGHPRDPALLRDPRFLESTPVKGLPPAILDMHQIVPRAPGVLEFQLQAMDVFGISRALLQSVPDEAASLCGNEDLLDLAATHPGKFWASHYVDPRRPDVLATLERLADRDVRVVKLLPPAGYRPDDPDLDSFWLAMQELGLVAMVHTGFISARHKQEEARAGVYMSSTFANPLFLDRPARLAPEMPFLLCHLGGAIWPEEAAQMVTQHDNVWGDVSGFGVFALQRLLAKGARLDWSKVFWGNDSPPFAYPLNLRLHLAALDQAGAQELAEKLLFDNGNRFAERFLA